MLISVNNVEIPAEVKESFSKFIENHSPGIPPGDVGKAKARTSSSFSPIKDIPTAEQDVYMERLPREVVLNNLHQLLPLFPDKFISPSGFWFYPKDGGYMGWHTNSDVPYERFYLVYSETGESWFKYINEDGAVVESQDKQGWNAYHFTTPNDKLFWHCVYTECDRWSFGFRMS